MENTVETGRKASVAIVASNTEAGKVLASRLAKLSGHLKTFTFPKVAKFASKSINEDVKFIAFLDAKYDDFLRMIPASFRDPDKVAKLIAKLSPEDGDGYRPNVKQVQAALDALCEDLVDVELEAKTKELSSYKIDDAEVQQKVANQLTIYRKALMRCVHNLEPVKENYGLKS